jgi:hypothetical protein
LEEIMIFRKTFLAVLLGCTVLAGCDGSNDKTPTEQSQGTFSGKENAPIASPQTADAKVASSSQTATQSQSELASLQSKAGELAVTNVSQDLADYVNTLRGSHSNAYIEDGYSRGLTFPATAVPFGFNMWTPVNRSEPDDA